MDIRVIAWDSRPPPQYVTQCNNCKATLGYDAGSQLARYAAYSTSSFVYFIKCPCCAAEVRTVGANHVEDCD